MSTLGKILIVVQVIMSLLFMCAAGAVYSVQTNWRDKSLAADELLRTQREGYDLEVEDLNKKIDELELQVAAETNRADQVVGQNTQLTAQVQDLTRRNNSLEQQLAVVNGVSVAAAEESGFRQSEAEQQRVVNQTLRDSLNQQTETIVQLRDEKYTLQVANDNLNEQYVGLLEQVAFLEKIVAAEGLSTDPREVADLTTPPPPVDGIVLDTRKDRTNRTEFAHVSIGSDDGLVIGHELDVYRTAEQNGGNPQYLGRIRIVHLLPDEAVGLVVEAAKNGIIEKGDNVTTRL